MILFWYYTYFTCFLKKIHYCLLKGKHFIGVWVGLFSWATECMFCAGWLSNHNREVTNHYKDLRICTLVENPVIFVLPVSCSICTCVIMKQNTMTREAHKLKKTVRMAHARWRILQPQSNFFSPQVSWPSIHLPQ